MRPAFAVLLLSSLTFAQTASKPANQQSKPASSATKSATPATKSAAPSSASTKSAATAEGPNAPVITIDGFCPGKQETGAACKTEVSKTEFEKLAKSLGAGDAQKRQLAMAYSQFLVMSTLADERGLDKRPDVQDVLKFVRMQALAQLYARALREEASNIPQADIDAYYKEHAGQFSQATLQRIFVPKMPPNPQEKIDEATIKSEGGKILAEAKKPDADFAKLQKQAYDDLKITATPPPTELKDARRESLPEAQAKAFDLEPGAVEQFDEQGGIYIYKLISKKTQTEQEAEPEIKQSLERQRFQDAMSKATANVKPELNEAYFGGPAERPLPQQMGLPSGAQTPSAPPASKAPATGPKSSTAPPK